jgi:hypothetical protein
MDNYNGTVPVRVSNRTGLSYVTASSSYSRASSDVEDSLGNGCTFSLWLWLGKSGANGIFNNYQNSAYWGAWLASDGKLSFQYGSSPNDYLGATTTGTVSTGMWIHIVLRWSGAFTSTACEIFFNGKKQSVTGYIGGTPSPYLSSPWPFDVGRNYYSGGDRDYLTGTVDNFMIFERPMSDSEIAALYKEQLR